MVQGSIIDCVWVFWLKCWVGVRIFWIGWDYGLFKCDSILFSDKNRRALYFLFHAELAFLLEHSKDLPVWLLSAPYCKVTVNYE